MKKKGTANKKTPPKKSVLTKQDFFKALDKVISVVKPKSSSKGKTKTSE
jgi:hypothetical protein